MTRARCWGILRERDHSPGRESDDAEILRLTGKALEARGFDVEIRDAGDLADGDACPPDGIFLMCERLEALRRLQDWAPAVPMVNSPAAVWNTYRERMIATFEEANVLFIRSHVVSTATPGDGWPLPVWIKRADVHNTQEGDVVFAPTEAAAMEALAGLAARDIPRAVIQAHVPGDLIKFYGIGVGRGADGGPPWFRWFHHEGQTLARHPFEPARLGRLVRAAAVALGLEVYGGDVIATPTGDLVLLDVNAWPSFALYREEAAARIAAHLASRFRGGGR